MHQNPYLTAIQSLNESEIRYVIVGGFAVVMHGLNRFTPDLNVVVDLESSHLKVALSRLRANHLSPVNEDELLSFSTSQGREEMSQQGKRWFLSLRDVQAPTFSLDLFLREPLKFEDLFSRALECSFDGVSAPVASLSDLITMKCNSTRGQDRMDCEVLRFIQEHEEELQVTAKRQGLLENTDQDVIRDYLTGLDDFASLSHSEKLSWLCHMLTHLGQFCLL